MLTAAIPNSYFDTKKSCQEFKVIDQEIQNQAMADLHPSIKELP